MIRLENILHEIETEKLKFNTVHANFGNIFFNLYNEEDDQLVANCFGIPHGNDLHVTSVSVEPEFRGKGYGYYFLKKLIENVKGKYKEITLDVLIDNTVAINLYKKLGFKIEGQVYDTNYPENDHYKMIKLAEIVNKTGLNIDWGSAQQKEMKYVGPENDYFSDTARNSYLVNVIVLGKYTTFLPHGGQAEVPLFPTANFQDSDWDTPPNFDKDEVKSNINYLKGLIKQGQYKVIK